MKTRKHQVTCSDVARHLGEELRGLLTLAAFHEIRLHLRRCPNCGATVDSVNKVIRLYRQYPDPELTGAIRRRLRSVLGLTS